MKIKMLVELFTLSVMVQYAEYCGWSWRGHTPRPANRLSSQAIWAKAISLMRR